MWRQPLRRAAVCGEAGEEGQRAGGGGRQRQRSGRQQLVLLVLVLLLVLLVLLLLVREDGAALMRHRVARWHGLEIQRDRRAGDTARSNV